MHMIMHSEGVRMDERYLDTEEEDVIDLVALFTDFLKVFKSFWWLCLIIIIITTASFSAYTYVTYTPLYQTSATFTVATDNSESGTYGYYYSQSTADQLSKTFPYILSSSYFRGVLLETMHQDTLNGTITSETVADSNMVTMSVTSDNAEDAFNILQTAIDVYPSAAKFVLGNIQFHMMNTPTLPTSPYNEPSVYRTIGIGGLIGVGISIVLLGIMALLRKTAKTPQEMEQITNLKCITSIPQETFKARKHNKKQRISILNNKTSFAYLEAIRSLQIRLDHALKADACKVILLTSTTSAEGKSTIAINLAELYAQNGKKVLLIDADLRKQEDAKMLQCNTSHGLKDIITNDTGKAKIQYLKDEHFWFIGDSQKAENPVSILSSPKLKKLIDSMKQQVDYIIIDTPPCGIFQDSIMLQDYADAFIYVIKHDYVPLKKVREGISMIKESHSMYTGYVFNCLQEGFGNYGYGYYGYGKYGSYKNYHEEDKGILKRTKDLIQDASE